jgi:hypothetical protein
MLRTNEGSLISHEEQRLDWLLWTGVLLGPLGMGINIIVGYTVAHWVCGVNHKTTGFVVAIFAFAMSLSALAISLNLRSKFAGAAPDIPRDGRRHFMAGLGISLSIFSILVVLAGTLVLVTLRPCD